MIRVVSPVRSVVRWLAAIVVAMLAGRDVGGGTESLEFRRDVLPILSDRCYQCHGPDSAARQADLRLDDRTVAVDERAVIVPGDPDASELIRRILSDDEAEVMPPPDANKELLDDAERAILVRWIREGAEYAPHWSFVAPQRPALPDVNHEAWIREPIDRFVLARLEAAGLTPSPEADPRMLIRRLALDLTGLPPSAKEVEAFVNDDAPSAYERLVDRLLASSHFGERMALVWLDVARYADTNGFSIDGGRHMWLWRDWVIDAFNRNLPYDQFLLEQLAGDLLPSPSDAQLIATGFQRNNMVTHEGGTIPEENLTNYNADRVKTLGEAVLGLTLGCTQCHDHKYDPISQRDYYRLFAYFNTLSDQGLDGNEGINPKPFIKARTVLKTDELPMLERRLEKLEHKLANPDPDDVAAWEAQQRRALALRGRDFGLHSAKLLTISTPNTGEGFGIEDDRFVRVTQPNIFVAYDVLMRLPHIERPVTGVRIVFHSSSDAPGGGLGFGQLKEDAKDSADKPGRFMLTSFSASADAVPVSQLDLNQLLEMQQVTASSWDARYSPEQVLDPRNESGWLPAADQNGQAHLTLTFAEPLDSAKTPYLTAQFNFGRGWEKLVAARFEVFAMTGIDEDSILPDDLIDIVETPADERSDNQQQRLLEYYATRADATWPMRVAIDNLRERKAVLTEEFTTMVMDVAENPRETFILNRGDYSQPTEKVEPGTPAVLPAPPEDAPPNRLGLAEWITMPSHPLTARVAVNRIWKMLFGEGIVRTAADFGAQGEYPSHPELLDWLAVDFVQSGWDVKRLLRQIVNSATYRQTSATEAELLAADPDNRLLARGPRFRLPAEFIRDSALGVSGLLVDRIGGPSVNPYTPGDLWREVSHYGSTPATAQTFVQDHGEKLYRRSLYTYWKRTVPPPNMVALDAPNREVCVVDRPTTNTPLQALVLLNDEQFVEAARAFAQRIIHHSGKDDQRFRWAFAESVSRPPSEEELTVLRTALARERLYYAAHESAADDYLASGESPRDESIPPCEHAAWSQVAAMLLNLSEFVTRN